MTGFCRHHDDACKERNGIAMGSQLFTEGVKPGGLTTGTEIRILLCYLMDSVGAPVRREELEEVLLGEELANYFAMADSLSQLIEQGLVAESDAGYTVTESGKTVARTLADDLPRTIRDTAVRGVIRAQQYAARAAVHKSEVVSGPGGRAVHCAIEDDAGPLFRMELYMPDELTAAAVREQFIEKGDEVYKLVLAALTDNRSLAEKALLRLKNP